MSSLDDIPGLLTTVVSVLQKIEAEVPAEELEQVLRNQTAVSHLIAFLKTGCRELPAAETGVVLQDSCRRILEERYFSHADWFQPLGIEYSAEYVSEHLSSLPNLARITELLKTDSILIPRPVEAMSLGELLEWEPLSMYVNPLRETMQSGTLESRRLYETAMTDEVAAGGWLAVRTTGLAGSFHQCLVDQVPLLSKRTEYQPNLAEALYAIIGYRVVTGTRLFEDCYVRVGSTSRFHQQFNLGKFGEEGIRLTGGEMHSDEDAFDHLGILVGDNLRSIADDFEFRS